MAADAAGAAGGGMGGGLFSAFGAGFSAVAAYNKAKADKKALQYQEQVQRNNAQLTEWQAQDAVMRGQVAEGTQRMRTAQLKGTQRASLAARGLALDEGSPLDILTTTDVMGERDALTVRDNAAKEAWALREQGKGYTANAGLLEMGSSAISPMYSATSTLLTGSGQVASQWYNYKQTQG